MQIALPKHDTYQMLKLVVEHPEGSETILLDSSHKSVTIELPTKVSEDDVLVTAHFMQGRTTVEPVMILKQKVEKKHAPKTGLPQSWAKPAIAAKPEPKEVKQEPKEVEVMAKPAVAVTTATPTE